VDEAIALDLGQQPTQEARTRDDHVSVRHVMEEYPEPKGEEGKATVVRLAFVVWCSFAVVL
jgi:hypothetical protein